MTLLIALSISIGLLAVVATWLFLGPVALAATFTMQIWIVFVAWAGYYHNGGKTKGATTTIVCMSLGAVLGMASVMLAGQLGALGGFAVPVAVGIGAALCVLAAHMALFASIPSTVYGFASIAGLILLGKDMSPEKAILPAILSVIVGAAFAWLSEFIGSKMTKA